MRKLLLKSTIVLALIFGWFSMKAQDAMSLYYLDNVPQSNFVNPAMAPRCNAFIGIPGVNSIYFNFNTDIPADVLLQQSDSGTISILDADYDYDILFRKIGKGANFRSYQLLSPISFGFKLKEGYVTFAMSEKMKVNMFVASDFFKLTEDGVNTGETFDFSNSGFDAQIYNEYAIGYSRNYDERLRLGVRLKVLQGLASIKSDIHTFAVEGIPDERDINDIFEMDMAGAIYSSGPLELSINEDGIVDTMQLSDDFKDINILELSKKYGTNFSNFGLAVDVGATYDLNKSWSFSASLNDLGFIRWRNELNSVQFNGSYDFNGIIVDGDNIDSINNAVQANIDTIKYAINYHAESSKFTTMPGTQFYLGAEYHVNHVFSTGFLSRSTFDRNYFHQEFNLSANLNLYQFLTFNLNYTISTKGENTAGMGLGLRGGPVQFYLLLDHIPTTYANYVINDETRFPAPTDLRAFNVMLGLNIILGHHGYKDEPKIDAYSEF